MNRTAASDRFEQIHHATNGVQLHCAAAGDGPLMLMLHGFPEFWYSWRHQMEHFRDRYRVVAPDLRGYNLSDKPRGRRNYELDILVDDVAGLIEKLGYETCVLVAHDWGGAVAWRFAYTHADKLDRLVMMNMPHPVRFRQGLASFAQLRRSWYILFFQLPWLPEKLLGRNHAEAIADLFERTSRNPDAFSDEDLQAYRDAASQPGALTAMLNYYRNIPRAALGFDRSDWTDLEVPTLLLWGEDDTALGKELTRGTDEYVRDLQIEYIPNCSHWVQQDRPDRVNEAMDRFLHA